MARRLLRWLGKLTSRALMHLADLSGDIQFKEDPEKLKSELLRRLNLEDDGLISIIQKGGRMEFGIDTTLAEITYTRLIEQSLAAAA